MNVDNDYITLYLVWDPNDGDDCYYCDNPRLDICSHQLNIRIVGTLKEVIEEAEEYYHEHFECDDDYDENFKINSAEELNEFWEANGYAMTSFCVNKKAIMEA